MIVLLLACVSQTSSTETVVVSAKSKDPEVLHLKCEEGLAEACMQLAAHPKTSPIRQAEALRIPCELGMGDSCVHRFALLRKEGSSLARFLAMRACRRHGQMCSELLALGEEDPNDAFVKGGVFHSSAGPTAEWRPGPVWVPKLVVPESFEPVRVRCVEGESAACSTLGAASEVLPVSRAIALDLACKGSQPGSCAASVDVYLELKYDFYAHQVAGRTCLLRGELCDRVRSMAKAKPDRKDLADWVRKLDEAGK